MKTCRVPERLLVRANLSWCPLCRYYIIYLFFILVSLLLLILFGNILLLLCSISLDFFPLCNIKDDIQSLYVYIRTRIIHGLVVDLINQRFFFPNNIIRLLSTRPSSDRVALILYTFKYKDYLEKRKPPAATEWVMTVMRIRLRILSYRAKTQNRQQ